LKKRGLLVGNRVAITIMSNMGVRIALKDMGINYDIANVGDRHVVEKMISTGAILGGEDSGHTIFLDQHTTGDGMLTALNLIEAMAEASSPLSELSKIMTVLPQVLMNVEVQSRSKIKDIPEIMEIIQSVETQLGEKGRVLVRYSGTQPLCRIMVEGPTKEECEKFCRQIAKVVKDQIG
jgi:phosphoglucosamine mutase